MTPPPGQKPKEGESSGLKPVTIGLALGVAAAGWVIAEWLRRVLQ